MKVLITGSTGVLGRHVGATLRRQDRATEVIAFEGDITDPGAVARNIEPHGALDAVIHLAAVVSLSDVESDPARAYAVNVGGTLNLLSALAKSGARPYFLYASTAHIYAQSDRPIGEDGRKDPSSLYGKTKYLAEQAAEDICRLRDQPFCAARLFSLFDPAQKPPFLYPTILERLKEEDLSRPFFLTQADSLRDFSPAADLADLMVRLLFKTATGPVNIGTGKGTTIRDFVQSLCPQDLNITSDGTGNALVADIAKLNRVLA